MGCRIFRVQKRQISQLKYSNNKKLNEQSVRLLQFYPKIVSTPLNNIKDEEKQRYQSFQRIEDEREVEYKMNMIKQQMILYENIKSYIQKQLLIDDKHDENLEASKSNQIFETRKKILKNQLKNVENIFNLNNLPKLEQLDLKKQNKQIQQIESQDQQLKQKQHQWFIFEHNQ
ncbi:hypothetical protein ABPG72_021208 [Tetrahymena utriculariae]